MTNTNEEIRLMENTQAKITTHTVDFMNNIRSPKITEVDGVVFRTDFLGNTEDALKRVYALLAWLPTPVFEVIKELDIELRLMSDNSGINHHSDLAWDGDRVILTIEPILLFATVLENPLTYRQHLISFFRTMANPQLRVNNADPVDQARLTAELFVDNMINQGVKMDRAKFVNRGVKRVQKIERLKRWINKGEEIIKIIRS